MEHLLCLATSTDALHADVRQLRFAVEERDDVIHRLEARLREEQDHAVVSADS